MIAVFALPRQAMVQRGRDSLVLNVTLAQAQSKWLVHILQPQRACCIRPSCGARCHYGVVGCSLVRTGLRTWGRPTLPR